MIGIRGGSSCQTLFVHNVNYILLVVSMSGHIFWQGVDNHWEARRDLLQASIL